MNSSRQVVSCASQISRKPISLRIYGGSGVLSGSTASAILLINLLGSGRLELQNESIALREREACIFANAPSWRYRYDGERIVVIYLEQDLLLRKIFPLIADCPVVMEFLINMMQNNADALYLHFYNGTSARYPDDLIERMLAEDKNQQPSYLTVIQSEFIALIAMLSRSYWVCAKTQSSQVIPLLSSLITYLIENIEAATLESAAKHLRYHPNTIASLCKRELGKTFSKLQRELRLKRANDLLTETSLPVATVAELCGYSHLTSFYKAYKAQFGTTPRQNSCPASKLLQDVSLML